MKHITTTVMTQDNKAVFDVKDGPETIFGTPKATFIRDPWSLAHDVDPIKVAPIGTIEFTATNYWGR